MMSYARTFIIISCVIKLKLIMFQTNVVEKIKTHILCSNFFPRKSCSLCEVVEKYGTARQSANDNMAHALCWLDT
jgi:hypothetical protein